MASRSSWITGQKRPPSGPNMKGRSSSGTGADKSCEAFCISLAGKLDALEQAVQPKWLTLEWVSLAVDFMRSGYSDMMTVFDDVVARSADFRGAEEFWVEEYMVESMKLLDVCNVLKPAMSGFEHFMMCMQLTLQASERCSAGSQDYASDEALSGALKSCESELKQLVHLPLVADPAASATLHALQMPSKSSQSSPRLTSQKTIAIGEKVTTAPNTSTVPSLKTNNNGNCSKVRGSGAGLALAMRATRETTDFVASVLVWALVRDDALSSLTSSAAVWQQDLDVYRGDETVWSPAFRRLQERLRKEMFDLVRLEERTKKTRRGGGDVHCFAFEELKRVEECIDDMRVEIEVHAARTRLGESPSVHMLEATVQRLRELLSQIQEGEERVSSQVNQFFNELVRARKKLLDAAQRPGGTIHRANTF